MQSAPGVPLKRSLSLLQATLYGLGVTIGAGIYVLIGAAAARAGMHAPIAFVLAAILMALTAASFAELAGRMPVAAGEAAYVRDAFQSDRLALFVGLLVVAVAVVSAAAISVGSAGYIGVFRSLPETILSRGGPGDGRHCRLGHQGVRDLCRRHDGDRGRRPCLLLILAGMASGPDWSRACPKPCRRSATAASWPASWARSLLAVFAFIGFESLANIAEEVREPQRTLPRAIFLTLALSTLLYVLVVWVALVAVPSEELAQSKAPLALVFERLTGASPRTMSLIAVVATLNGIIVQIIMASRVLYGLARQGELPGFFGAVNERHADAAQCHGRHDGAGAGVCRAAAPASSRRSHLAHHARRVRAGQPVADPHQGTVRGRHRPAPTSRPPGCHGRRWPRARAC